MTAWILLLVAACLAGLWFVCTEWKDRTAPAVVHPEQPDPVEAAAFTSVAFAAPGTPDTVAWQNPLPILLVPPTRREMLKYLSPFVVGGWGSFKSQHVAAWLRQIGDPNEPWALILWAPEKSVPSLRSTYDGLPGWLLFVNEHPPAEIAVERVYLVEDVWHFPERGIFAPSLDEIHVLAELGTVILVPDPEGMVPDYLEPARSLANQALAGLSWSHVVGLAGFPLNGNGNGDSGRGT